MKEYHYAWLRAHPDRTEAWLRERFRDGFHVHHVDGDSANNDPLNLVLIEGCDHMRLHGMDVVRLARRANRGGRRRAVSRQRKAAEEILRTGMNGPFSRAAVGLYAT